MPIWLRKFTYQQIVEAKQKEAEAIKGKTSRDGKKNIDLANPNLGVEQLAEELFLSRSKLYRKIKALTGDTATEFIRKIRLEKAKELLEKTDLTVSEIGYKVGFSSPSYFTKCFKNQFGRIPKEVRLEK